MSAPLSVFAEANQGEGTELKYALTDYYSPVLTTAEDGTAKTWGDAQAGEIHIFDTLDQLFDEIQGYVIDTTPANNPTLGSVFAVNGSPLEIYVGFQVNVVVDDDVPVFNFDDADDADA